MISLKRTEADAPFSPPTTTPPRRSTTLSIAGNSSRASSTTATSVFRIARLNAACVYTLIETCKLNHVDPHAWLTFVLAKLPIHLAKKIDELPPWNWKAARNQAVAAEATEAA